MRTIIILLNMLSLTAFAQHEPIPSDSIAGAEQQIWIPFKTAFEALDARALNALYSPDSLRITDRGIDQGGGFRRENLERFAKLERDGVQVTLDFWLDSTRANEDLSYNVGFYRLRTTAPDGTVDTSYGQFHILLERRNDRWLIKQDWDSASVGGVALSASDYERMREHRD